MNRICFPFVGDSIGGSHKSTILLIKGLLSNGEFQPIIVLHEKGPLAAYLDDQQLDYVVLPLPAYAGSVPKISRILISVIRVTGILLKFIKKNNISAVHGNDLRINLSWPVATRLAGASYIWHQRVVLKSASPFWKAIPFLANHVICISKTVESRLAFVRKCKRSTIYNPFDFQTVVADKHKCKRELLDDLGLDSDTVLIGFVGSLNPQKRPKVFIRTAAELQNLGVPKCAYVLIGKGTDTQKQELQELVRKKDLRNFFYLGFCDPIETYLASFDVLVAPAVDEGFGRVIVESLMQKVPVVASNSAGHTEIIEDRVTGILTEVDDHEDLAGEVVSVIEDEHLRKKLAEQGFNDVISKYDKSRHISQVSDLYKKIIEKRPV